ncbi:MAG: hypothetical protein COW65_13920 [Cytophagales bacterium CG18_big_fil_WC_8_21_14_2_50_42_9]|nr:MAG: hypothetical protein COW65_13920 [Cytophagales bacterium CG18_big_fil_WC_8_21_14_2_50_42_9]
MSSRSAEATIKGYYYQFDTSISKLLDLTNDTDSILIEGIEDIDIDSLNGLETVQCKYLTTKKCTDSAIREPILLMLDHFVKNSTKQITYTLYAHFSEEQSQSTKTYNLSEFKKLLTYKEKEDGNWIQKNYYADKTINDATLTAFLKKLKIIFGEEFYTQQQTLIDKLKTKFNCTEPEAQIHFYNNALRTILNKAILPTESDRKITYKEFIEAINCRQSLFTIWFKKYKSQNEYLNLIGQTIKSTSALTPSKNKLIFLGKNVLSANNADLPINQFIINLISKHYKVNFALHTTKPPTLILDLDNETMLKVKKQLLEDNINFNDGYEHISFSNSIFNKEPVINISKATKISKSSYIIKLASRGTFEKHHHEIDRHNAFLYFSNEDFPFLGFIEKGVQLLDIKYCEDLKEVSKLVC